MEYLFFVCLVVIFGVAIVIVYRGYKAERQRTVDLQLAAEEMGFEFTLDPGKEMLSNYSGFHLFSRGHHPSIRNFLRGQANGLDVSLFDFTYVTGSGKSRHTWRQTVVAFAIDGANLPTFSLRPETVFHKIGKWFGYQDINFEAYPAFSKSYLLRGANEDAIRELFGDRVLEYYEDHPGVCTEGRGDRLVYYQSERKLDATQVRPFLEEGFQVLAMFHATKQE